MNTAALLNEFTVVERPLIDQLVRMGWRHIAGDIGDPAVTERPNFRDVLLRDRLGAALRRINLDERGAPWLDDARTGEAIDHLDRLGAPSLMEANGVATRLLLSGTVVEGNPARDDSREQTVRYIDFEHPERNDFLAVNQFRVDLPGVSGYIVPDLVLFVNGIPLVVIECKSPAITAPLEEAITQILRYSNGRDWIDEREGVERLFHYNQFLVATSWYDARVGTTGASYEHYLAWKDTSPLPLAEVAAELGVAELSGQQTLVAGMLRPALLLDIVRNFTLFQGVGGRTIKIVARYQQFRAVQEAVRRLATGKTRAQHGESDGRGGIIWHTQGSGKSLTMVFFVRKLRTLPDLRHFKIVVVTDRTDLEKQLAETAALTGEPLRRAKSVSKLKELLREEGADLVFAMIQKYQDRGEAEVIELAGRPQAARRERRVAEAGEAYDAGDEPLRLTIDAQAFPVLNDSEAILVLVDEAHRTQEGTLHANLLAALPNCARIGFTGTPIMIGNRRRTHEIFGDFIDRYTIQQSEADGATVPILYEGRTAEATVADGRNLDELFEDMFRERTPEELEAIKKKYATTGDVLEAPKLIAAKATDMLRHYVEHILPNGFKAQVVATSRLATVRYVRAFHEAHTTLVADLAALDPALLVLDEEQIEQLDADTRLRVRAKPYEELIRRLDFATIISRDHNDPPDWAEWTDEGRQGARIARFKKPLGYEGPTQEDPLAFLIVKSMLLTGFDAPIEQALYLDRMMKGHELLQAIARVNRTAPGKTHGLVVDYYGVGRHLKEALAVYSAGDVQGALRSLTDELPELRDRHRRAVAVFADRGLTIDDGPGVDACVELLRDAKIRAEFAVKLEQFLETLDLVLPRPEGLPYVRDAKVFGFINKVAANRYRDEQLNLAGAGHKVRALIDRHIKAHGIDPKVPPISIMDADFERSVGAQRSDRAKASEMEHAARYHISKHYNEDPAYYKKLSQRLEEILQRFEDNWDELVRALLEYTREVREGRPADETGLDPKTQAPFLGILRDEAGADDRTQLMALAGLTVELVDHIRQEVRVVDFWRKPHAQTMLRSWLVRFLDDNAVVPSDRQQPVADRLMELTRELHNRLSA